jgi:hypothetical protein
MPEQIIPEKTSEEVAAEAIEAAKVRADAKLSGGAGHDGFQAFRDSSGKLILRNDSAEEEA